MFGWVEQSAPPIFYGAGRRSRALFRDEPVLARLCFPSVLPASLTHQTRLNAAKLGGTETLLMREWTGEPPRNIPGKQQTTISKNIQT